MTKGIFAFFSFSKFIFIPFFCKKHTSLFVHTRRTSAAPKTLPSPCVFLSSK